MRIGVVSHNWALRSKLRSLFISLFSFSSPPRPTSPPFNKHIPESRLFHPPEIKFLLDKNSPPALFSGTRRLHIRTTRCRQSGSAKGWWRTKLLGSWAPGVLGSWAPGLLGPWAPGLLDSWAPGLLGSWDPGTLGPWVVRLLAGDKLGGIGDGSKPLGPSDPD